ncbi:MAG: DNA topoisomerase (ATP-hydrolyzing) subunit B [Archaeoglobaceae archaeon]
MEYSAENIEVLDDLEAVRKRPSMYIGGIGVRGLHHLLWEVLDNSVDEALGEYCDEIKVRLYEDGSASVEDNGRGIPTETHMLGKSALEIVMTKLHAGGKFSHKSYRIAGGLHGVGVSVVNALSEWLDVWVSRDGKIYNQRYEKGNPVTDLNIEGESEKTGTKIRFKPDDTIFESTRFDHDIISQRLRELSFLNKGIRFKLVDERENKEMEYFTDEGIKEYVSMVNKNREVLHDIVHITTEKNGAIVEVAIQFTDTEFENVFAFANNIRTVEGGTHVAGFKAGLTRAINEFGKKNTKKFDPLSGMDVREGLTAVISVKVPDPQFEGQTKTKLTNTEVKTIVETVIYSEILQWFLKNPHDTNKIIEKCMLSRRAREAAKRARELVRKRGEISVTLPGKLADCSSKKPEERELFIVEGESAGGSAKQARNREFQAILPIKGKIINVEKAGIGRALKNEEIKAIASAIGAGIGSDFDSQHIRYRRVIIMTDADVDGAHIKTLLLTFFYRQMKPLIEQGYLYIAQAPLYRAKKDKKTHYIYSDKELEDFKQKTGKADIQRFKGLGEMNPDQLWETTMDPNRRILAQVTIEDALEAERLFTILMGEDVESRRQFIFDHSQEAILDV